MCNVHKPLCCLRGLESSKLHCLLVKVRRIRLLAILLISTIITLLLITIAILKVTFLYGIENELLKMNLVSRTENTF
jgi:hypothetical protein